MNYRLLNKKKNTENKYFKLQSFKRTDTTVGKKTLSAIRLKVKAPR